MVKLFKKLAAFVKEQWKSFIFMFACLFFICNILLVSIFSYTYYQSTVSVILQSVYRYTYAIMNQTRYGFDQYMSYHRNSLLALAANDNIISAYQCYGNNNIPSLAMYENRLAETIKNILNFHPEILDIAIITNNGFMTNKETRNNISMSSNLSSAPWYETALNYDRNGTINIFKTNLDFYKQHAHNYNAPVIAITQPLFDYLQNKIGIVVCFIDADILTKSAFNKDFTEYGDLSFVDSEGEYLIKTKGALDTDDQMQLDVCFQLEENTYIEDIYDQKPSSLLMHSDLFDCSILYNMNIDISRESSRLILNIILILLLSIFINLILTCYLYRKFNTPMNILISDIQHIKAPDYLQLNNNYAFRELNIIASTFNTLMKNIHILNHAKIDMELSLQKAKNSMLLSKINPHFLFNALQLIQTENMYGSKEKTNSFILSLSNQLRYNIYEDHDNVPLKKELNRTIEYLQLTKSIYENRFDYQITISEDLYDYYIPKFSLHILVENSIKHGFECTPSQNFIHIDGLLEDNYIKLSVQDNGKGIDEKRMIEITQGLKTGTIEGIGLKSLAKQLEFIYGDNHKIEIQSDSHGTRVTLSIPCISTLCPEQPTKGGATNETACNHRN